MMFNLPIPSALNSMLNFGGPQTIMPNVPMLPGFGGLAQQEEQKVPEAPFATVADPIKKMLKRGPFNVDNTSGLGQSIGMLGNNLWKAIF